MKKPEMYCSNHYCPVQFDPEKEPCKSCNSCKLIEEIMKCDDILKDLKDTFGFKD